MRAEQLTLQLINKVAGVYGLITVIVGGTFWQFLYYAYSFATLWAFLWALSVIKLEVAKKSLFVAHLYVIDHAIAWVFHYIFYYSYWYVLKHDGARILNSQAQKDIFDLALDRGETQPLEEGRDQQAQLAHDIWNKEKGYALGVIAVGFLLKVSASERGAKLRAMAVCVCVAELRNVRPQLFSGDGWRKSKIKLVVWKSLIRAP